MSNTELKSVGEMCEEIKSLKAENKSLKATNKSFRERFEEESSDEETSEEFERGYETCKNDMFDQYDAAVNPLKAEIKSLKEELDNRVFDKQGAKDCFDLVDQEDLDEANEEIEKLKAENEKLEYWRENEVESPWEAIIMIKELTDENKKLKDQVFHEHTKDEIKEIYRVSMELKEENEKLFKFTIGGGEESEVEKIITEKMNKEFIDGNQEHWDDIGLFQDEESEVEDNDPEEYGEYMAKQHMTREEIEAVDNMDPETGEIKA